MKPIECNSEIGTSIGLIDALVTIARLARSMLDFDEMICGERGDKHQPVREALKDLSGCRELRELIDLHDHESMQIIHAAAELLREGTPCLECRKRKMAKAADMKRYRDRQKASATQ